MYSTAIMERRTKLQPPPGKGVKAFIGKTEKQCNKCGFVTLCLHVLYKHKHKCRGQLLGHPIVCSYCKRKFNFVTVYRVHKVTCVKKIRKQFFFKLKLRQKHLKYKEEEQKQASSEFSFSCPICHASFRSKLKFVSHLKEQKCKTQVKTKKSSFSARKSFNHKTPNRFEDQLDSSILKKRKYSFINDDDQPLCKWCRCLYPSQKLLIQHLEFNADCAKAYFQMKYSNAPKKASLTARKTMSVVAKKSFSHKRRKIDIFSDKKASGSARKSLPSSQKKLETYNKRKPETFMNPCPVCFKEFSDTFTFFQHQKEMNHWGKATKSANSTCKCPFCGKEFFHITARNIHIRSHSDVSQDKIKAFLRSQMCSICSESFASELAKQQHMRIEHPSRPPSVNAAKYSASGSEPNTPNDSDYASKHKMSSVPSSVKKKLKQQPNTCPICSKAFSHTVLRNKHFNEVHLKIFECQFCNTKFKSISSLNNHIDLSHGKDFECRECKVRLKNELQLLQHVLKSHPNKDPKLFLPVKLKNSPPKEKSRDISEEGAVKSTEKVNFNFGVPGKNMEYYCDVCDIGYLKLCGLQRHRQSKLHKDTLERNLDAVQKSLSDLPPSPQTSNPRVVKQPEIITCSECSEEFTTIKDFVPHRLSHFSVQGKYLKITELNPYMCEVCSEVLGSHSKVQLHLFWHLQIESTSNTNSNFGSSKKDTIVPDRLSGQHVAKKSFSKQSNESLQEVVIGGVSKPLFTCEACNIGFTTKAHYSMHVRKLCKKINTTKAPSNAAKSGSATSNNKKNFIQDDIVHCRKCNFLFSSPAKHGQHKPYCSKCYFDSNSEECLSNSDAIKSAFQRDIAVAGCITCGAIFDSAMNVAEHLNIHQEGDNLVDEDVPEDVLHCALCNCLFPLQAFKVHKDFCKIPVNIGDKVSNSKHMNVLKSALELKCAVAGCISCGVPFDDLETFVKHLTLHQTNQIQNEPLDRGLFNGEKISIGIDVEDEDNSVEKSTEFLKLGDHSFESDDEEHPNSSKSIDYMSDSALKADNPSSVPILKETDNSNEIEDLQKNFSQLLCLLISDPELMQTLGFGTLMVEDVLINVLQQMGQESCTDETSNLDRFRKNIQILLDLCLKDQIMEAIGNKKTTDEIVVEALKIFTSDENMPDADDLSTV